MQHTGAAHILQHSLCCNQTVALIHATIHHSRGQGPCRSGVHDITGKVYVEYWRRTSWHRILEGVHKILDGVHRIRLSFGGGHIEYEIGHIEF